jgi:hypothetical protein
LKPPTAPALMIRSGFKVCMDAQVTRAADTATLSTPESRKFNLRNEINWQRIILKHNNQNGKKWEL